jgi:hypothetical protein
MKSHPPTLCVIVECANKCPGKLLAKALAHEVDLPYKDAVTMCERNSIDPFQICGDGPLKQLASTDTSDITPLRREIQAHAIDIDAQLSIIRGIILRLDALESKLNHRNP